jgi:hypothetical protein
MVKAISKVGDAGYKIKKVAIAEASFEKEKLAYAQFLVLASAYNVPLGGYEDYELLVSVGKSETTIVKWEKVN